MGKTTDKVPATTTTVLVNVQDMDGTVTVGNNIIRDAWSADSPMKKLHACPKKQLTRAKVLTLY